MKIIIELEVPASVTHYIAETVSNFCKPDDVTDNGNLVFRTGLDTAKKHDTMVTLLQNISHTRLKKTTDASQIPISGFGT